MYGPRRVMSVAVLLCIFVYLAFFPSAIIGLLFLVGFAVSLHGCLYVVVCMHTHLLTKIVCLIESSIMGLSFLA